MCIPARALTGKPRLGALATPVSFGALVDWLDTYTWAWLAMALCSGIAAICFTRASRVGPPTNY